MLLVLLRHRTRILAITFGFAVLGVLVAFLLRPTFTATATMLPPQAPQSSASALLGQLGSLSSLGAGGAASLLKNPGDIYVAMLQSRTTSDRIIARFHLMALWKQKKMEDTRKLLTKHASFEAAKDGLITITVKDPDPNLASNMANAFVDELYRMNATLATTEAGQRRVFFDQQLQEEQDKLSAAEASLQQTQEKTGLIELGGQSAMAIRTIAEASAELRSREVELQSLRAYATEDNPDVMRVTAQIAALRRQIAGLENSGKGMSLGDTEVPAGRVPAEGLEYARKLRDVKYHQALFDLLSRQFEAARIDEAKSAPVIQVVDRAVPPDKKSGPPRTLIILGFTVIGFCVACFLAFAKEAFARMRQDQHYAEAIQQVGAMLHLRL